jgi:hypothetical protein
MGSSPLNGALRRGKWITVPLFEYGRNSTPKVATTVRKQSHEALLAKNIFTNSGKTTGFAAQVCSLAGLTGRNFIPIDHGAQEKTFSLSKP